LGPHRQREKGKRKTIEKGMERRTKRLEKDGEKIIKKTEKIREKKDRKK
jgi:hypothetical protein